MLIRFFYPRWGSDQISWDHFLNKVKVAGYYGVEIGIPEGRAEREYVISRLSTYNLKFIAQHFETDESDFFQHKKKFQDHLKRIAEARPLFINSHTGKDFFSQEQNNELLDLANQISKEYDIEITHETHRGRFSFAAHVTESYLRNNPAIELTLDVSHWFCVAESLLLNQEAALNLAVKNTVHIHARIGHSHGPQVNNPHAPEWKEIIDRHLQIWDEVITEQKRKGAKYMDITTEFGPWPYSPSKPFSRVPFTSQWNANKWMLDTIKSYFPQYL